MPPAKTDRDDGDDPRRDRRPPDPRAGLHDPHGTDREPRRNRPGDRQRRGPRRLPRAQTAAAGPDRAGRRAPGPRRGRALLPRDRAAGGQRGGIRRPERSRSAKSSPATSSSCSSPTSPARWTSTSSPRGRTTSSLRTPMVVDEDGFQELSELHTEMLERTLEIQARSAERMAESERGRHPDRLRDDVLRGSRAKSAPSSNPERRPRRGIRGPERFAAAPDIHSSMNLPVHGTTRLPSVVAC